MRRLAFAAAVCGTLVLASCSDQTPTEPTAPPPEQSISPACRPSPHFPIVQVAGLIIKVFPKGKLQFEALVRGAAVALFWETCKKAAAQKAAVDFVNFMNANSSKLTGTTDQKNLLIRLVLNGVGIPFITPPLGTADYGLGIFFPGRSTVIKTLSGTALIALDPGSFLEQTVIVITRRADDSDPLNFVGNQFPPFWDYDAINASGNHVLQEGHPAIIAFCLLNTDVQFYPENREVGHNPVFGAPGFPFEILEDFDLATERPALYAELVAKCPALQPNTIIIGGFGQGVPGVANAAWRTARYYLAPAATLLLPEALHAATLAVEILPPPSKRIRSVSPVGTVEFGEEQPLELNLEAVEKLPGGTQRFTVQSGAPGPYIWSVNGVDGGNSTFGVIVVAEDDPSSADYTAPATVPSPATFDVCARRQTSPSNTACASVTIQPVPSSGADIIVFNDLNMLDNTAASDPNNIQLFKNLVNFTATGSHASGNSVLIHQGHASRCGTFAACGGSWTSFVSTLSGDGYTVINGSDETTPLTSIGSDVKVILLAMPTEPSYSDAEINSLKAFAGAGGRIVFVGEHESFYGTAGIAVENAFLEKMGAEMRNTGGSVDCGYNVLPASSLRDHQVTAGLDQLTIACASVVDPGPNDYPLFYDLSGTQVLGAVAKIDLTPLAGLRVATPGSLTGISAPPLSSNVPADVDVFSWGFRPRK